jgi:hypothetical protein
MTGKPASDPVLAADFSASGDFVTVGTMHAPGPAFAAAIRDLQDIPADPELLEIAAHCLASNAFGICTLENPGTAHILRAWLAARLAADWRIGIAGIGHFQALFTVARFEPVQDDERAFALGLRLAGKPGFHASKGQET